MTLQKKGDHSKVCVRHKKRLCDFFVCILFSSYNTEKLAEAGELSGWFYWPLVFNVLTAHDSLQTVAHRQGIESFSFERVQVHWPQTHTQHHQRSVCHSTPQRNESVIYTDTHNTRIDRIHRMRELRKNRKLGFVCVWEERVGSVWNGMKRGAGAQPGFHMDESLTYKRD